MTENWFKNYSQILERAKKYDIGTFPFNMADILSFFYKLTLFCSIGTIRNIDINPSMVVRLWYYWFIPF